VEPFEWLWRALDWNKKMRAIPRIVLVMLILTSTSHQLPAPIVEETTAESAPRESARPKPKRTIKPKVTTGNTEGATKRPTPQRNPLDGTWSGTLNDIQFTAVISGSATIVRETSAQGTFTWNATYDGRTMRWTWKRFLISGASTATIIDSNGRTALVTSKSGGAPLLLGAGAHNTSAVFYKISP
jgi:hypothetical protein